MNNTIKYKRRYMLLNLLSILFLLIPLIVYIILGFIQGTVGEAFILGCSLVTSIVLVFVNIVFKYHIRSIIWILMIGLYISVNNLIPLLFIIAITTILDEFILQPLIKVYKSKYIINKEIDKRS